jgi:hypothetical protein
MVDSKIRSCPFLCRTKAYSRGINVLTHLSTVHARGGDEAHPPDHPIWTRIVLNIHSRPELTEEQKKVSIVSALTFTDPETRKRKNAAKHRAEHKKEIAEARRRHNKMVKCAAHLARKASHMAKYQHCVHQVDRHNAPRQIAEMLYFGTRIATPAFDVHALLTANQPQQMHFALFVLFYLPISEWPSAAVVGACDPGKEYPFLSQLPSARHYRALQTIFHPDRQYQESTCTAAENRDQRGHIAEIVNQIRGTILPFRGNRYEVLEGFHLTPHPELAARLNGAWALWDPAIRAFAPDNTSFILDGTAQQIGNFTSQSSRHARIMELYQVYRTAYQKVWNMVHPTAFSVVQLRHILTKQERQVGENVKKVGYDSRTVHMGTHLPAKKRPGPKRRRQSKSGVDDEVAERESVEEGDPVSWSDFYDELTETDDSSDGSEDLDGDSDRSEEE